jgi:phosphatidylglycerol:prolipoprotein diacylglycerol transferase
MHPVLFEPFGFKITSFGVTLALAFFFAWMFTLRQARRTGWFAEDLIADLLIWLMVGGVLGARILYVIVHWDAAFSHDPIQVLNFRAGGLVSYGGLGGATFAGWWFTRRRKIDFLQLADMCIPGAMLGQAIGRIGCFLVADDYGKPAPPDLPWAVRFPDLEDSLLPANLRNVPLHPTQIYLLLKAAIVFFILWWLLRHRRFKGQVFCAALVLYPIARSIVEVWRGDAVERGVYLGVSTAQWLSIPIVLVGIALYLRLARRPAIS